MIKLIAADLDGTLLTTDKRLPPDFGYVLNELNRRGIMFVAASGRQYYTLRRQFNEFQKDMTIIAENGSSVFCGDNNIICEPIDPEKTKHILDRVYSLGNISPILCGFNSAYGEARNLSVITDIKMFYSEYKTVDSLYDILTRDRILKFALHCSDGAEEFYDMAMRDFSDEYGVFLSGPKWVDIMKKGVSKGSAIDKICKIYGINKEECVAFGDYMNDFEMMSHCGETYAMANAYPELKKVCKYECKSNDEYGVTEKIKEILNIKQNGFTAE